MRDLKISKDVREQYIDASVALFMEYYAASFLDGSEGGQPDTIPFPASLDARCRALIKRECFCQRRKRFVNAAGKGLRAVACAAAVVGKLCPLPFYFKLIKGKRIFGRIDVSARKKINMIKALGRTVSVYPGAFRIHAKKEECKDKKGRL